MSTGPQLNRKFSSPRWQRLLPRERQQLKEIVADLGWVGAAKKLGCSVPLIETLEDQYGLARIDAVERLQAALEKA